MLHIFQHLPGQPPTSIQEAKQSFTCSTCGKSCKTKSNLKLHMKRHLPRPPTESFEPFSCHFCTKVYRGQKAEYLRDQHEKMSHAEKFIERTNESFIVCQYCGKIYEESTRGKTAYLQHQQKVIIGVILFETLSVLRVGNWSKFCPFLGLEINQSFVHSWGWKLIKVLSILGVGN
jgi:hypothetical protein